MMYRSLLFVLSLCLFTCFSTTPLKSSENISADLDSDSLKCNLYILGSLAKNLENPSDEQIEQFLYTFDTTCRTNVEYSESSNELLFEIFKRYPARLLEIILESSADTRLLVTELRDPVQDAYNDLDVDDFIQKLEERQKDKINVSEIMVPICELVALYVHNNHVDIVSVYKGKRTLFISAAPGFSRDLHTKEVYEIEQHNFLGIYWKQDLFMDNIMHWVELKDITVKDDYLVVSFRSYNNVNAPKFKTNIRIDPVHCSRG